VRHSPDREPVTITPKATTFSKFDLEGHEADLLVVSVHGINFETNNAFRRQMDQIERELRKHRGPIFLAGDFNTWNRERTDHLLTVAQRLGLAEAPYVNGDDRMSFNGWPLDHVFIRGLAVRSATVDGAALGSDHKPIFVEFEVPQRIHPRR
jgi:endonuclease/exonuclease/phosphatase (EEP) superfamily protein YafD